MTELREPPVYSKVSTEDPGPVASTETTDDKPPSYFNVVSQIKAAKESAKNPVDLTQKTVAILCQSGNQNTYLFKL